MHRKVRISRRVRVALGGALTAGILVGGAGVSQAEAANFIRSDLDFILQQIDISEQHAAGGALFAPDNPMTPDVETGLVVHPSLPFGVRTVDGRLNNILPGQDHFGAADTLFPRLVPPLFRTADAGTTYATSGNVTDAEPRVISNLIVDQTSRNPAATQAHTDNPRPLEDKPIVGTELGESLFQIPNVAADEGLSASYNSWFTFFGQFFDHGLDLITKGGEGNVTVPLQADDPLLGLHPELLNLPPAQRAIPLTRATTTVVNGVRQHTNTTTPFVDQNQTYTSHPAHQAFLREYERPGSVTVPTGRFLDHHPTEGGLATWLQIKTQAQTLLGIQLSDQDIHNVPLIRTDQYGNMIPGPNGFAQFRVAGSWIEGTGAAIPANADRTGHAFLDDIAHLAQPGTLAAPRPADLDDIINPPPPPGPPPATYDDELLNRHFVTGDGRGNENIALTAVHFVFHAEHNRLVDEVKRQALAAVLGAPDIAPDPVPARGLAFLNAWLDPAAQMTLPLPASTTVDTLVWNGARVFQAARFGTEMQYQHLVFEEFARKVQPEVNIFDGYHTEIDPKIVAEFAHTVYRFGHSMLNETVPREGQPEIGLIEAFLNPTAFGGATPGDQTASTRAIVEGTTAQIGNELDEFVTSALRNNLLGRPLDLATFNLARGRDTGIPGLNAARRQFFADTGHPLLTPYESWADFGLNMRYGDTALVNFIAAFGTHSTITGNNAQRRAAAATLIAQGTPDAVAFMTGQGIYSPSGSHTLDEDGVTRTGLGNVDFWIGGLAEKQMPFGGLLGSSFNYVFETQMEKLQDGDRFYYLGRTAGLNFLTQLEENSFAEMIMSHTGATHLPFDVFSRPDFIIEANDPTTFPNDPENQVINGPNGLLRYVGGGHIVWGGTGGPDNLAADIGDDTIWGDAGNDRMDGGAGNDALNGNDGNDVITDGFGIDNIKGGPGNDSISAGTGTGDLTLAGSGDDVVIHGDDEKEAFLGTGDDVIRGSAGIDTTFGNEGDDWIEGGDHADLLQGGNGDPFQEDGATDPAFPNAEPPNTGNDVIIGDGGNDDYDSEGGDDIMVTGPGIERNEGMLGFDWVTGRRDPQPQQMDMRFTGLQPPDVEAIRDRFDAVEALSGWNMNDVLRGDDRDGALGAPGDPPAAEGTFRDHELNTPAQIARIQGLQQLLTDAGRPGGVSDGNIIVGGAGSDIMEGRGGNDIIDGDRWLDVNLAAPGHPAAGYPSVSSLQADLFDTTPLNPGQISILRQLKLPAAGDAGIDLAVFSEPRANYSITFPDGPAGRVVVDHVSGGGVAGTPGIDGRDTLLNVEILAFNGGTQQIQVGNIANNQPPTGTVGIQGLIGGIPVEGTALTALTDGINDPDGINPPFTFEWEALIAGVWTPVPGGTNATFIPTDNEVGSALRVTVRFFDGDGVPQFVQSGFTPAVANVNDAPTGTPAISRDDARVGRQLTATAGTLADADGLPAAITFQWQRRNAANTDWENLPAGANYTPTNADLGRALRVIALYTDGHGTNERVASTPTNPVRDGGGGARILVLGRAIVPGTTTADAVARAGVPVTLNTPADATVVRVRVFAGKAVKPTARVFLKVKGGASNARFVLNHARIKKALRTGGTFRIELTPGLSRTELGSPTVRTIVVAKAKKPKAAAKK